MRGVLWYDSLRYGGPDEDEVTAVVELGRRAPLRGVERLGLTAGIEPGFFVEALGLPRNVFCLVSANPVAAVRALGTGLILTADAGVATGLLVGDEAAPPAAILAEQSAVAAYPGLDLGVPGYVESAYLDLVRSAAHGLHADLLALNPPTAKVGVLGARELGAPLGATSTSPVLAMFEALERASPGQRVLLVSYRAGSAADAILLQKRGT